MKRIRILSCLLLICVMLAVTIFPSLADSTVRPMVQEWYDIINYGTCDTHKCSHDETTIIIQDRQGLVCDYGRSDAYFHQQYALGMEVCKECNCIAVHFKVNKGTEMLVYHSTETSTGKSATQHWTITSVYKTCPVCGVYRTSVTNSNYANHNSDRPWIDGGHLENYHYYHLDCDTCAYRYQTVRLNCPGGNNHAVIQRRILVEDK